MTVSPVDWNEEPFIIQLRNLAAGELRTLALAGEDGAVNRPLLQAIGAAGLIEAILRPQTDSGSSTAAPARLLCLIRETLGSLNTAADTAVAVQALGAHPIVRAAKSPVTQRWLPDIISGRAVAAFALSEPDAGSDAAALTLRAAPHNGGWRLTGTKKWISNAPQADIYTVFARTSDDAGARGVSAFAVPAMRRGITGERLSMLSPHPIGVINFDDVEVSSNDLLGDVGAGMHIAMQTLDLFRPSVGAFALGMAQSALDAAVSHTRQRKAFGAVLGDMQTVSHMLAEMATRIEAARLLVYSAADAYDATADARYVSVRSAMAKLFATETAQYVVDAAMQLHGAAGLQCGSLLEHLYREVRAPRIYEGASEVQREIIARRMIRHHDIHQPATTLASI